MVRPKIVSTIEARMTSSRLPGKVLMTACEKAMLQILIERIRLSKYIEEIVVATTENKADDSIIELCENIGVKYFRGSEMNVLDRVCKSARSIGADVLVEITGDDILIDPTLIDDGIEFFLKHYPTHRYVANTGSMPWGFDFKIFMASDLYWINENNPDDLDKEHVSYSFYRPESANKYNPKIITYEGELNRPTLRVTLDYREDYKVIKTIYEDLYPQNPRFGAVDVIRWLDDHPDMRDMLIKVREEKETNTLL